jgi:iron complex transport system ATP-binding protein
MKLQIQGIQFDYGSVPILRDVTVGIDKGQILSLVGPNGSGKTTLLRCVNRILKPKTGTVIVGDLDIGKSGLKELALYLGYVPQSAPASFPLTVFDTVLLGRKPHVTWKLSERDKDIAFQVLEMMELDSYALRLFNELSGGEKQKVLIARAICQEPKVLLMDEPTSNLDLKHQLEALTLISNLVKERGLSAVLAMHDLNLASRFSNKIAMLKQGVIHSAGDPGSVLTCHNIREVYGVDTEIMTKGNTPYIIPMAPVNGAGRTLPG